MFVLRTVTKLEEYLSTEILVHSVWIRTAVHYGNTPHFPPIHENSWIKYVDTSAYLMEG